MYSYVQLCAAMCSHVEPPIATVSQKPTDIFWMVRTAPKMVKNAPKTTEKRTKTRRKIKSPFFVDVPPRVARRRQPAGPLFYLITP